MADEDNKQSSQNTNTNVDVTGLKSEMETQLGTIKQQMQAMSDTFAESMKQFASAINPPKPQPTGITDADLFDPQVMNQKVEATATTIASQMIERERALNTAIYNLTQEYPEIQTKPEVRKAVLDEHQKLAKSMQGTADGYEVAVLKAVAKQGILPKSKRPDDSASDADFSAPGNRGPSTRQSKQKIDQNALEFARLLGQPVDDPEYQKRLEKAGSRKSWNRYE